MTPDIFLSHLNKLIISQYYATIVHPRYHSTMPSAIAEIGNYQYYIDAVKKLSNWFHHGNYREASVVAKSFRLSYEKAYEHVQNTDSFPEVLIGFTHPGKPSNYWVVSGKDCENSHRFVEVLINRLIDLSEKMNQKVSSEGYDPSSGIPSPEFAEMQICISEALIDGDILPAFFAGGHFQANDPETP